MFGLLSREKRRVAGRGGGNRQVADAHVHSDQGCRLLKGRISQFDLQRDEQVKAFPGLVVPELGPANPRSLPKKVQVLTIAAVWDDQWPGERQDRPVGLSVRARTVRA